MPRRPKIVLKNPSKKPDYFLISLVLGLTVFGLVMVGNVSAVEAYRDFGDKLYYFKLQAQWAIIAVLIFSLTSLVDYRKWRLLAVPLLVSAMFFLILVLIPGIGIQALGAKRWLSFGPIGFQPAEWGKFALVIYLSAFFSKQKRFWPFFLTLFIFVGLVMLEPDLGTALIISAIGFSQYFCAGAPLLQILILTISGIASGIGLILSSSYRKERLLTFLNPGRDPLGASYHIRQILIALAGGGLFGVGLGQSRQKYQYLPEVTTDSIFAVVAEELGFIGGLVVVAAFLIFVWRGLKIAKKAPDDFGGLLAVGISVWIGSQSFINLSSMVALAPLTGVPLPFISYGGSSLVLVLAASGILVNISRQTVVKK